jgi:WD40 repeat protein
MLREGGPAFSPDGKLLTGMGSSGFSVWDVSTGKLMRTIQLPDFRWPSEGGVCFSADGKNLLINNNGVRLVSLETGKPVWRLESAKVAVGSGILSPDGKALAIGTQSASVQIVEAATGRVLREIAHGKTGWVGAVAYSPDGRLLVRKQ